MAKTSTHITTGNIDTALRDLLGSGTRDPLDFTLARMIAGARRDLSGQQATRADCVQMGRQSRGVKAVIGPQESAPNGPGVA